MGEKRLTPKQAAFVAEYLVDLNATAAAERAGYKNPNKQGPRLLVNVGIANAIGEAQAARAQRTEITQDRVLKELARIGFADIRAMFEWDAERAVFVPSRDLTDDQAAAISGVESETVTYTTEDGVTETKVKLKLKTYDKLGALEKIGKHLGMFKDGAGLIDVSTWEEPEFLERVAGGEDPYRVAADRARWLAEQRGVGA